MNIEELLVQFVDILDNEIELLLQIRYRGSISSRPGFWNLIRAQLGPEPWHNVLKAP